MAQAVVAPSAWQRLKLVPERTPLRVKLIAGMLVLVTVALAVISVAGVTVLRGYLLNQADDAIVNFINRNYPAAIVTNYLSGAEYGFGTYGPFTIEWLPDKGPVRSVVTEVTEFRDGGPGHPVPGPKVTHSSDWLNRGLSEPLTVRAQYGPTRWRVVSGHATLGTELGQKPYRGTIIVGYDVSSVYRTLGELTVIDLIISALLLIILALLGIAVIRSSLQPLTDIEQTAEAIAAGDLSRRVPENDPRTEVGRLGRSLNLMLSHIEMSFRARAASEEAARRSEEAARYSALSASRSEDRMRRFVADASHELRTPLTAIRGYAEYYRQRGGVETGADSGNGIAARSAPTSGGLDSADLDRMIERVEQEAKRMGVLVDDLLLLARLDQERPLDFRSVDLLAIAADALHDARVIAPDRTITLTVGSPDAAIVIGDEVGLRQVVANLMSNAISHTPADAPIDITIKVGTLANGRAPVQGEPAVILEVADHGPGLSADQQEHVFERFYRTDRSRSRAAGGTGLGLAIVAALVSAHHGRVWIDSEPGSGATFGFALPLAPEARLATH
jgi:two-component system, OmpR family, sensor kinase